MSTLLVGIDEVGRGPVAGPVTVCAFAVSENALAAILADAPAPLRDSKKLTPAMRARWITYLNTCRADGLCSFAVASVPAGDIDTYGINPSIASALGTALAHLAVDPTTTAVYLDGGLRAPVQYLNQTTLIQGDSLVPIISLASIVAKETRDTYMKSLGAVYPQYGFEKHMGYGTAAHYEAIKRHGVILHHRISFLKNLT